MRRRAFISVSLAILAVFAVAPRASAQSAAGTYTLAQVGDAALPAVVERDDGCVEEIVSGTLTLNTDGTWVVEGEVRETCGTEVETEAEREDGRYTVEGAEIRFGTLEEDDDDDEEEDDEEEIEWEDLALGTTQGDALVVALEEGSTTLVFRR